MTSRGKTPIHQSEVILASEADRRVSTANGRPVTSSSTNQNKASESLSQSVGDAFPSKPRQFPPTPDNTPRHTDGSLSGIATLVEGGAHAGDDQAESILDQEEMFMTLTAEERRQWEEMMKQRSDRLNLSREQHDKWVDSFTRRRMFAYSRMRKLQESFQTRSQFLTHLTQSMARASITSSQLTSHAHARNKMEKRFSEPIFQNNPNDLQAAAELRQTGARSNQGGAAQAANGDQIRPGGQGEAERSKDAGDVQMTTTTPTTTATANNRGDSSGAHGPPRIPAVGSKQQQQQQQQQFVADRKSGQGMDQDMGASNGHPSPRRETTPFVKVEPVNQ